MPHGEGISAGLTNRYEAEAFWTSFLRKLTRPGLKSVKLVVSDGHEDFKAAAAKVLSVEADLVTRVTVGHRPAEGLREVADEDAAEPCRRCRSGKLG